ncbi:hypothetical protein BDV96DRAFT_654667 [Lophiotrema nucula]|uniref:Transcription factor domain-containing protein n=1 Tax=Lophiotrema nucula TaxID=690887 RepID=A0A6A5YIB6_9PLEO|nr:hypothetical protein BDV96DRAFT_654667 [Lophiotrema nucula]
MSRTAPDLYQFIPPASDITADGAIPSSSGLASVCRMLSSWPMLRFYTTGITELEKTDGGEQKDFTGPWDHVIQEDFTGLWDYAIQSELDRGSLRVWGVGEGDAWGKGNAVEGKESTQSDGGSRKNKSVWGSGSEWMPKAQLNNLVVSALHDSYIRNISPLYPILDKKHLKEMIEGFLQGRNPERRPSFAIVMLVFALGEVCNHPSYPPAPLPDSAVQGIEDWRPLNIDLVPGMSYFRYASDIIGTYQGSLGIDFAQANLLAAIYMNQLIRPTESYQFLQNACKACTVLIKTEWYRLHRNANTHKPTLEPLRLLYWSCVLFEA